MNYNHVQLAGNLTRDPDLKFTPQGTPICRLGIAVNREWKDASGEKKKEVHFFDITVWGKSGENCSKYLNKGSPIFCDARLQTREYDAKDGTKRKVIEIVADNVQFLGSKPKEGNDTTRRSTQQEPLPHDEGFNPPPSDEEVPF